MQQLLVVVVVYLMLGLSWLGRLRLLILLIACVGPPAYDAHRAGMARLRRAGLARADVDGVELEGRVTSRP